MKQESSETDTKPELQYARSLHPQIAYSESKRGRPTGLFRAYWFVQFFDLPGDSCLRDLRKLGIVNRETLGNELFPWLELATVDEEAKESIRSIIGKNLRRLQKTERGRSRLLARQLELL